MKKIIVKLSNERLITPSGLTLVGGALGKSDLVMRANRMAVDEKRSQPQIKNGDILQANVTMFNTIGVEPTVLESGNVPLDLDVTPFDNSKSFKEGVSRTYKGFDGYAPMMAYIGAEGYMANTELWEGKQHSQSGTPAFGNFQ